MRRFRAPGSRIEHFTADDTVTLCGIGARAGARYGGPGDPAGTDIKLRPICGKCRAAHPIASTL
jgi:hypothetical protein